MAGTLNLTINTIVTNGNYSRSWTENPSVVQNAAGEASGIVTTTTTKSTLDVGGVTTLGFLMAKNLDAVNSIDLGFDSSGTFENFATLKAGEVAIFRPKAGITLQVKAQAGTPQLQFWLLQD